MPFKIKKNDGLGKFFTRSLMQWNVTLNSRMMPWKGEKDPYKIWLSEIILQQTKVEQGLEYYNRFIKKYPDIKRLAAAKDEEVFKLWEGLGYYSRCKNLLATARFITGELHENFPDDYKEILKLKGVGPYTAAAIASFAFNHPYAVVDGNVSRVLARFFGINKPIDNTAGKLFFAELAQVLLDKKNAALYNQAIMDFGATVCKPKLPLCSECILKKSCQAFLCDEVNILPIKEKKLIKRIRWFYYILAEYKGKLLVKKRTGKDIWQNLHEFILIEEKAEQLPEKFFKNDIFKTLAGEKFPEKKISGIFKQQLTHQTIYGCFIYIKIIDNPSLPGYSLMSKKEMAKLAFPKFINYYLEQAKMLVL